MGRLKFIKHMSIFLGLFIILSSAYAKKFPRGCEEVGFHFENQEIILNENNQQNIYFIENNTKKTMHLKYDEKKNVFMSVGWEAELNPKKWVVFASDQQAQHFQCFTKKQQVMCHQSLRVCSYPRVKFATSNQGSYWIAKNVSLYQGKRQAIRKGILLRW
jgi:hypothetical protein